MKTIQVHVHRKNARIATEVFPHELPILRLIHPEGVKVINEDYSDVEVSGNVHDEYARLRGKYNRKNAPKVVEAIYPTPQALADETGLSFGGQSKAKQESVGIARRRTSKAAIKDDSVKQEIEKAKAKAKAKAKPEGTSA